MSLNLRIMLTRTITLFFLLTLLIPASCRQRKYGRQGKLAGYADMRVSDVLWPDPENIPVCWEEVDDAFLHDDHRDQPAASSEDLQEYQKKIEEIVTQQYARAGIKFTGWKPCRRDSRGIRIQWTSNGSTRVLDFGKKIDGRPSGLWFDPPQNQETAEFFYITALHEFGHAIGLRHEASRRDNLGKCKEFERYQVGELDALAIGVFDERSMMNYCIYDIKPTPKPELSDGDIATIRAMYFKPMAVIENTTQVTHRPGPVDFLVTNVTSYRYLLVEPEQVAKCQSAENYSTAVSSREPLKLDLTDYSGKTVTVCLVGGDNNTWQDFQAFTSHTFKVGRPPFASIRPPQHLVNDAQFPVSLLGDDPSSEVTGVALATGEADKITCTDESLYVESDGSNPSVNLGEFSGQTIRLCVRAKTKAGKWQDLDGVAQYVFFVTHDPVVTGVAFTPGESGNPAWIASTSRRRYKVLGNVAYDMSGFFRYKVTKSADKCSQYSDYSTPMDAYSFYEFNADGKPGDSVSLCAIASLDGRQWSSKPYSVTWKLK